VKSPCPPPHQRLRRRLLALLATGGALSGAACTGEKELVVTAKLEVSETGAYTLDGASVSRDELKHAVRAKRPKKGNLLLHVVASPNASYEAVGHAMQAAQFAGAQVGIVGNERF
jgi:biopolymer transport protein ExbD